jgi:hypothetical protein
MIMIQLAKACRRREKGAKVSVSERAAYRMMADGFAVKDLQFIKEWEARTGIKNTILPGKPGKAGKK